MGVFVSDSVEMQQDFNQQLMLMLDPRVTRIPKLSGMQGEDLQKKDFREITLLEFWKKDHNYGPSDTHLFSGSWEPLPHTTATTAPACAPVSTSGGKGSAINAMKSAQHAFEHLVRGDVLADH